jgi:hypothetical protein
LGIGGLLVLGAIGLGIGAAASGILGNIALLAVAAVIAAILYVGLIIAISAISAVIYPVTEESANNKRIGILNKAKELLGPVARYTLVTFGLFFAVMLLPIISAVFSVTAQSDIGIGITMILVIIAGIAYIIALFLIQFALLELVLRKKGAVESLRISYQKVRRNWLVVLGFDIAFIVIYFGISLAFAVVEQIVSLLMVFAAINIALLVLVLILYIIIILIQALVTALLTTPFQYFFWKRLK